MPIRFEIWLSELGISINVKQFIMQKYITDPKIIFYNKHQIYSFPRFGSFRRSLLSIVYKRVYIVCVFSLTTTCKHDDASEPSPTDPQTRYLYNWSTFCRWWRHYFFLLAHLIPLRPKIQGRNPFRPKISRIRSSFGRFGPYGGIMDVIDEWKEFVDSVRYS